MMQIDIEPDEVNTIYIEIITLLAAIAVLLVVLHVKKKYSKLTRKGFGLFTLGVLFLVSHFLFDFLDTVVLDESNIYYAFDILDATLFFVGLFVIGFAFMLIAKYGTELWEGKK
ncbi:MAG: hypothetical protein ACFFCS_03460 [Candidatus Hodarchaeota archaeon]